MYDLCPPASINIFTSPPPFLPFKSPLPHLPHLRHLLTPQHPLTPPQRKRRHLTPHLTRTRRFHTRPRRSRRKSILHLTREFCRCNSYQACAGGGDAAPGTGGAGGDGRCWAGDVVVGGGEGRVGRGYWEREGGYGCVDVFLLDGAGVVLLILILILLSVLGVEWRGLSYRA